MPTALAATHPRVLLLTNLFRDQLDRYGEIDLIAKRWTETAQNAGSGLTLAVNVDDPLLAHLVGRASGPTVSFGIEDRSMGHAKLGHEADRHLCPACDGRLIYDWCFYGHLGHYRCSECHWVRPVPQLAVTDIKADERETTAALQYEGAYANLRLGLPGLHNVYNATAAVAAALAIGLELKEAAAGAEEAPGVFGRHQRIQVGAGSLTLLLVKNPVGFNQALLSAPEEMDLASIAINDLFADGTDVSWLWDVDFDPLVQREIPVRCTGLRAYDMAVRLKYDGANKESLLVEPRLDTALQDSLREAEAGSNIVFFSTYTATLEMQRLLARRGLAPPYWEG